LRVHEHVVHARTNRTLPKAAFEAHDRVGIALGHDLHAAIVQVAYVTGDAFPRGGAVREIPESHALHPTGHDKASSDEHETVIIDW
jgi:hypothetical protein